MRYSNMNMRELELAAYNTDNQLALEMHGRIANEIDIAVENAVEVLYTEEDLEDRDDEILKLRGEVERLEKENEKLTETVDELENKSTLL